MRGAGKRPPLASSNRLNVINMAPWTSVNTESGYDRRASPNRLTVIKSIASSAPTGNAPPTREISATITPPGANVAEVVVRNVAVAETVPLDSTSNS